MFNAAVGSRQSVMLGTFGGLITEAPASSLSEGSSPLNYDCDFLVGTVFTRPGLRSVYGAGVNRQNFVWIKTYAQQNGQVYTLSLAADGTVWREDVTNNPGVLSNVTDFIAGDLADSTTAFNKEYICLSQNDLVRQYNGTTFDEVSQDGPAAPLIVGGSGNVNPASAVLTAYSITSDVITFTSNNSFQAGEFVQFQGTGIAGLDGQTLAVLSAGLSSTAFEVDFTAPNASSTPLPSGAIATPQNTFTISTITQPAQQNVLGSILQSTGPGNGTSAGNVYTIYYGPHSTPDNTLITLFQSGLPIYVYIDFVNDSAFITGTYRVTGIGSGLPVQGSSVTYYFTVQAPNIGLNTAGYAGGGNQPAERATYQITLATVTMSQPIPGLETGGQASISGDSESSWNNTWSVVGTPNAGTFEITQDALSNGVATYTYVSETPGVTDPAPGDLVTIVGTTNTAGGTAAIFNVTNATIATVSHPNFTIGTATAPAFSILLNQATTSDSGVAQIVGSTFYIDPGPLYAGGSNQVSPIFGNGTGGDAINVNTTQNIAPGTRQAVVMFLTVNGYLTRPSPAVTFTVPANAAAVSFTNIPIGPPNVIARWIAITEAGANGVPGAFFYVIPEPVSTIVNGQPYTYAPTVINDNTTTSASFSFTDAVLLSSLEIDIPGADQFNLNVLGSARWNINYAGRMFYGLAANKINNLLNMHFDGGTIPQPGIPITSVGGESTTTSSTPSVSANYQAEAFAFSSTGTVVSTLGTHGSQNSTSSVAFSTGTTTGNTIIVTVQLSSTGFSPTIADGASNTWTMIGNATAEGVQFVTWMATAVSTLVSDSITITLGSSVTFAYFAAWNVSGLTGFISEQSGSGSSATTWSAGNINTFTPNVWVLATYMLTNNNVSGTYNFTAGWTGDYNAASGPPRENAAQHILIPTATGSLSSSFNQILGWTTDATNGGNAQAIPSSVAGDSYYASNNTGTTQTDWGMIAQSAYQDSFNAAIIQPNTAYSARIMARIPSGLTTGNLVLELIQFNPGTETYGTSYGTFTIPFSSLSQEMSVQTGTLLTTAFTTVPSNLVLRLYETSIGNGADVEVKYIDVFPTNFPTLTTQLVVSYVNNPESFDGITGLLGVAGTNTQPVNGAFVMYDQLYLLKSGSMFSTQDTPGSEPSGWQVQEVSNVVGTVGPNAYDVGEEWAVTASRQGLYVFYGKQPVKLSQEIFQVWEAINWNAASTIQVKNDIVNRRILVSVPMSTGPGSVSAAWLPNAPVNTNPTSPNVMLMLNYLGLGDVMSLGDGEQMHATMFGTLMSTDMRRKWSIWQIPSPYMNFINNADGYSRPLYICNGIGSGKIYQLETSQLSDDGTAIDSLYTTYGFVDMNKIQQNPLLGWHRKQWVYLQMLASGSGSLYVTALMNNLFPPQPGYIYNAPPITLSAVPTDDYERPLNAVGNRVFLQFRTKAVGAAFTLQRVIMVGNVATLPIRGIGAQ